MAEGVPVRTEGVAEGVPVRTVLHRRDAPPNLQTN